MKNIDCETCTVSGPQESDFQQTLTELHRAMHQAAHLITDATHGISAALATAVSKVNGNE